MARVCVCVWVGCSTSTDHLIQLRLTAFSRGNQGHGKEGIEDGRGAVKEEESEEGVLSGNSQQKEGEESNKQASPRQPCFVLL